MSDSVRPHRRQPTRLLCPWDSPGKNTGVGCHFLLQCRRVKSEITQSCLTLRNPMDCSPPRSSIHGIFQARVLEWGAIAFSAKRCFQAGILMSTLPCVPYVRNMYMGVCMCSRIDVALMAMLPVPDPDFSVHVLSNFPCGSAGKESACSVGDLGSISGLGRSPGVRKGYPLQYCGLENSMDCIVHGVANSWTRLSDLHFHLSSEFCSLCSSSASIFFQSLALHGKRRFCHFFRYMCMLSH